MKLFRVTCRGMHNTYGVSYVVAPDPTSAYNAVREALDRANVGFAKDRDLDRIEQVADEAPFACPLLYVVAAPPSRPEQEG